MLGARSDPTAPEARIAALPCWQGPTQITPLGGGMTNHNYLVQDALGRYAVRLGHDLPAHGVMRFNELAVAKAAHAAGLSPQVVHAQEGIMVSRFIEGRTLAPADIQSPSYFAKVVALVHQFHHLTLQHLQGPVLMFWVFHVIRSYANVLRAAPHNPLGERLLPLVQQGALLEQQVGPVDIVLGHNDLLAANFLDDGQRLWLIDFDYAGFNSPLFDLANLSSNNGFDAAQDQALLGQYFDTPHVSAQRLQAFKAMKQASLLREALWGAVSQVSSNIEFDYAGYTQDYLARLDKEGAG
jgi:thiamine kinase-like enzyme